MAERDRRKFSLAEKMKLLAENSDAFRRRTNKPLTEKRRRERINKCLVQLKSLILKATGKEEKKFARLEKADILEMTVDHLRQNPPSRQSTACSTDLDNNYQQGYNNCAFEVLRCLDEIECVDINIKTRLMNHLSGTLNKQLIPSAGIHSATDNVVDTQNYGIGDRFTGVNYEGMIPIQTSCASTNNLLHPGSLAVISLGKDVTGRDGKTTHFIPQNPNHHQSAMTVNQQNYSVQSNSTRYVPLPDITSPSHVSSIGLPLHSSTPINKTQQKLIGKRVCVGIHSKKSLTPLTLQTQVSCSSSESSNELIRNTSDPTSSDSGNSSDPWRPW